NRCDQREGETPGPPRLDAVQPKQIQRPWIPRTDRPVIAEPAAVPPDDQRLGGRKTRRRRLIRQMDRYQERIYRRIGRPSLRSMSEPAVDDRAQRTLRRPSESIQAFTIDGAVNARQKASGREVLNLVAQILRAGDSQPAIAGGGNNPSVSRLW